MSSRSALIRATTAAAVPATPETKAPVGPQATPEQIGMLIPIVLDAEEKKALAHLRTKAAEAEEIVDYLVNDAFDWDDHTAEIAAMAAHDRSKIFNLKSSFSLSFKFL